MKKDRVDHLLVERGLAKNGASARAMIMAGLIYSGEKRIDKAGVPISIEIPLEVRGKACPFVSRGGLKLQPVLDKFSVGVEGLVCADIGASTGGFTDCLLKAEARRVFAVDVGHGQLDATLLRDPRVVSMEKVNARYLDEDFFPELIDLVVIDVSFISLKLILPAVKRSAPSARVLAMVKPQFEAGRKQVGKGGVVRDPVIREETVNSVRDFASELGYNCIDRAESTVKGPKGNIETFLYLIPDGMGALKP